MMEKILYVMDASDPVPKSMDFACYLANLTHSKLTGVFLENVMAIERKAYAAESRGSVRPAKSAEEKRTCCEEQIIRFKEACIKREVIHNIHRDRGIPQIEVIEESRFADMIIVDAQTSFTREYQGAPTAFVKAILRDAECPVVIAPENFDSVGQIVFAYDDSKSALFALKQFTYLLPQFRSTRISVLQINEGSEKAVKQKYKLKEWLTDHYDKIDFSVFSGDSRYTLLDHLLTRKNCFVIMGAYGRNILSNFLNKSHAEFVIKVIDAPVFIAHP